MIGLEAILGPGAGDHADGLALLAPGGAGLRHAELAAQVAAVAAGLVARGVEPGDPIGIVGPNGPALAVAVLAVAAVATAAPLNPALPRPELAFELADLGVRAVVVVGGPSPAGAVAWPDAVLAVTEQAGATVLRLDPLDGGPPGSVVLRGPDLAARVEDLADELTDGLTDRANGRFDPDVALVLHTSGTTARPKIVPLTRANLAASARAVSATLELEPHDVGIEVMPLFHVHGLVAGLLAPLRAGSAVVATPGFHAPDFAGWFVGARPTWLTAVPTMHLSLVERLAGHASEAPDRPLRLVRSSSASLAPGLLAQMERVLGAPMIEAYGMTEGAHQLASNGLGPDQRRPGRVGQAAGAEIRVRVGHDAESGRWAEPGEAGEVVVRGPGVTAGYVSADPEVNRRAWVDGWLRTGDLGWLDDEGYLTLTGRLKELINRGGEKISPREVDEVLLEHPAVSQAVTFGVTDPRLGEAVAAAVVAAPQATPAERDLRQFVAQRLAVHKVPRRVVVVDRLPTGPSGKVKRVGLGAQLGLEHPDGLDGLDGLDVVEAVPSASGETGASAEVTAFVAQCWVEVLGLSQAPQPDQHFLDLGGDSMAAARLLATMSDQLDLEISMLDLFDRPTVASQAGLVEALLRAEPVP